MTSTIIWTSLLLSCLVTVCKGRFLIHPLGHIKLPLKVSPTDTYKLLSGSAEEASYDPDDQLIYVIGEGSRMLHVIDVSDPMNPVRVLTHEFALADGIPRDVEVCNGEVVVALSAEVPVFPGHVFFFQTYKPGASSLVYDGKVTVGEFPDNLKFSPNCRVLVVANEGISGLDHANRYVDPEGSLTIIYKSDKGNPSERFVDFNGANHRHDIRGVAKSIPNSLLKEHSTVAQDLEPEYITMPDNSFAYITFQENNAIAKVGLKDATVHSLFNLDPKEFKASPLDPSDKDGGIHMKPYNLLGLRGPDVIKSMKVDTKTYLFVADEGRRTVYTKASHNFAWSEGDRARIVNSRKLYDTDSFYNPQMVADINKDSKLGRLYVSQIDGISPFTGKMESVHTYGGRGFSIWDPASQKLLWDSGDELERRARDSYYNVFNTDVFQPTAFSPETLKDTASDDMGPKPNAMDVIRDNNHTFVVVGSETTGLLYLYDVSLPHGGPVGVVFHDIYRRGSTDTLYQDVYDNNMGIDLLISDIEFIPSIKSPTNRTMFYVLGAGSGSVSLYDIEDLGPDISLNP